MRRRMGDPLSWGFQRKLSAGAVALASIAFLHFEYRREEERYGRFWNTDAPKYVQFANRCAKVYGSQATGFDPGGYLFLRPKPGKFHVLVTFLRRLHAENSIELNLPALIRYAGCKYIMYDSRANDLRGDDLYFLRSQYFPLMNTSVLKQPVVFASSALQSREPGKTRVTVPGRYWRFAMSAPRWDTQPLGWLKAGDAPSVPAGDWLVCVGSITQHLAGDQFGKWMGYKSEIHDAEDGSVRSSPAWLLRYVPLTGDQATRIHQ
jgi:hypothetical protein